MKEREDKRDPERLKAFYSSEKEYKMFKNGFFNPFSPKCFNFCTGYTTTHNESQRNGLPIIRTSRINNERITTLN